jgi:hypothetical protein
MAVVIKPLTGAGLSPSERLSPPAALLLKTAADFLSFGVLLGYEL